MIYYYREYILYYRLVVYVFMYLNSELDCVIIYIYIYAFSRRFYSKGLTVHSSYTFVLSVCVFPGN